MVFWVLLQVVLGVVVCDNIRLMKGTFSRLTVGSTEYYSDLMRDGHSLKVSYPGCFFYVLVEESPGCFSIEDRSVYLGNEKSPGLLTVVEEVEGSTYISAEIIKLALVMMNLGVIGLTVSRYLLPRLFDRGKREKRE